MRDDLDFRPAPTGGPARRAVRSRVGPAVGPSVLAVLWLALAVFPLLAAAAGGDFYVGFVTRLFVFALAASSLNLVLGYGGMVSFGHAAFFGAGAYAVGVLAGAGLTSFWLAMPLAVAASAALALAVGAVSLRTRGVYFIMITLAFAQMIYFLVLSLQGLGGEDGLPVRRQSLGLGLTLRDPTVLYYLTLLVLTAALYGLWRLVHARFGVVLQAIKENEGRMAALGYPVRRYQLAAFVIGGGLAGLAGVLSANLNGYASPSLLAWQQSGHLMVMVILGGVGQPWGGVLGAAVILVLEEALSGVTIHWQFFLGLALLAVVLFAPGGLSRLMRRGEP